MSIFKEINEFANPDLIERALLESIQELEEFVNTSDMTIADLEKGFDAAKRGLGLANKLKVPADKKKHLSRVLTNMNKLRSALQRLINAQVEDYERENP